MFLTVFVSILFCVIVLLLSNEVFASVYWFVVYSKIMDEFLWNFLKGQPLDKKYFIGFCG